jgi:D-alanyl-D-alanine dipeptidase
MRSRTRLAVILALAFALPWAPRSGQAEPAALVRAARQLVLVVTPDWNAVRGELRRFELTKTGEAWRPVGAAGPIVVGRNGTAWDPLLTPAVPGPRKAEGDGRSPAGAFPLGTAFGYAPAAEASWLKLPYRPVADGIECVDDPASAVYNRIVDRRTVARPDWKSAERMREAGEAYRWGVVVDYNTPPVAGRGSCIFLHIGGEGGAGTLGCTAMSASLLREVMAWLDPAASPVLVQLPRAAYEALRQAWALP